MYWRFRLNRAVYLSITFEVYGRIENALDESYQEEDDFISPDRASYIGKRLNF